MKTTIITEADRERFIQRVRAINLNRPFIGEIKARRKVRSIASNRLLWMWLQCIQDETGNDKDTLYKYFCQKFLPEIKRELFGDEVIVTSGSSKLDSKQFTTFLDSIKLFMNENGVQLPEPGDDSWDDFYAHYNR